MDCLATAARLAWYDEPGRAQQRSRPNNQSLFFILFFSLMFAHLWWFGFLGLGSWIGFLRLGFSVDRVWGLWWRAVLVFRAEALYLNNGRISLGKKLCTA